MAPGAPAGGSASGGGFEESISAAVGGALAPPRGGRAGTPNLTHFDDEWDDWAIGVGLGNVDDDTHPEADPLEDDTHFLFIQ